MPKDVNAAVATIKTKRTIQFVDWHLARIAGMNPKETFEAVLAGGLHERNGHLGSFFLLVLVSGRIL